MDFDWMISHLWIKGICFQKMKMCIYVILFIVLEGQSGGGLEGEMPKVDMPKVDMPKVEMPKFELPTCLEDDQGQDMTWERLILSFTRDLKDMTQLWNKDYQILDENATTFVHSLHRFVYGKTFSCLPKFMSLNSDLLCGCDYDIDYDPDKDDKSPLSDSDKKEGKKEDTKGTQDWIGKIKEMIRNVQLTVNKNIDSWTLKDTFLFFCSVPGLLSVVVQMARFCFRRRIKNLRV